MSRCRIFVNLLFGSGLLQSQAGSFTIGFPNGGTNYCAELHGGNTSNGNYLEVSQCDGGASQQWAWGSEKIVYAAAQNKCIDAGNMKDGQELKIWDCNGYPQQAWGYDSKMKTLYLAKTTLEDAIQHPDASMCAIHTDSKDAQGLLHVGVGHCGSTDPWEDGTFVLGSDQKLAAGNVSSPAGGTVKLAWSDCGDSSTHGHITSLSPDTLTLGAKTSLAGKGKVDEAIESATYNVDAKAAGITVFSHNGDACKPETIMLPAGAGEIDMKGFSCPISAGAVELDLDVSLTAAIPSSLARVTIDLTAASSSGDKALCVQIKTSPGITKDTVLV